MGKGIKGLSYLGKLNIIHTAGSSASVEAYRTVLKKVEDLQANSIQDITLTAEVLEGPQPYYTSTWTIVSSGAVAATGTVSCATAIVGNTVTVNGNVYTAVAGAKADNTEFSIDTSDTATAADLADSITNDTRSGTTASLDVTASANEELVTITATTTGFDTNVIDLSSSGATLAVSAATLTAGVDPTTYTLTYVSETTPVVGSIAPVGLSTKRLLDIAFTGATNTFTVRSLISVLNWIERYAEVRVSSGGLGTQATGTATLASVLAADTVTVNGLVYTAVSGAKANNTEFSIDGTDTVDAADLVDSITNDTRTGTLSDLTATNLLGVVTFSSTAVGAVGNATTLVSSNGTRLAVSGATFSGGADAQDGTYTNAIFKGATPNITFTWTVVKLGDVYTLTSTATS
tara:strand:+ start:8391 stop:9602 length:1212 start_codon:yes stop_codon:yes gene_type:complete